MEDEELLAHLTKSAKENFELFTNSSKEKRERWVVEEFLSISRIRFAKNELHSPEQESKVDVYFRDAKFQIKEITDPNFKRGKFYKDEYHSYKNASSINGVSFVSEGHDSPKITNMYDLVLEQAKKLADDARYKGLKGKLDLMIYVTRPRSSLIQSSEINGNDYLSMGWRSVSCLNSKQAVVLFSSKDAPDFLKNISGKINKNKC